MAIIVLKGWYLDSVLALGQVADKSQQRAADLRLSKTGLLKNGMRADFLDDVETVRESVWFERYLLGDLVEFYLEGSGVYSISNLDLISREIYFNKRATFQPLHPTVFWIGQGDETTVSHHLLTLLNKCLTTINTDYAPLVPLTVTGSPEGSDGTIDAALLRTIRQAVLVVADVTGVVTNRQGERLPHPWVMLQLGYALQYKRPEQLILLSGLPATLPIDVAGCGYFPLAALDSGQSAVQDYLVGQLHRLGLLR
ncbi:MAG: hypothetical protein OHK0012_25720 [Synechococcales cyanobacterium]